MRVCLRLLLFVTLTLTPLRVIAVISVSCLLHPQNDQMGLKCRITESSHMINWGSTWTPKKKLPKIPIFWGASATSVTCQGNQLFTSLCFLPSLVPGYATCVRFHVMAFFLHPGRLTWNLQITRLERKMIFQTCRIMFHVNLQGCFMWNIRTPPTISLLKCHFRWILAETSTCFFYRKLFNSEPIHLTVIFRYLLIYHKKSSIHVGKYAILVPYGSYGYPHDMMISKATR